MTDDEQCNCDDPEGGCECLFPTVGSKPLGSAEGDWRAEVVWLKAANEGFRNVAAERDLLRAEVEAWRALNVVDNDERHTTEQAYKAWSAVVAERAATDAIRSRSGGGM